MAEGATPSSEAEAAAIVAEAAGRGARLRLVGGGTKAAIGRPPQEPLSNSGATLSAAGLTGITLYEPAELVIGARAGTPLGHVAATLAARGQALAFEPPDLRRLLDGSAPETPGEPTIGAVAAVNLSGPRRVQAGAARDGLIGVRFVNGRGEVVVSGGRVMKNVTGLDLVKLMAGSWGTLGFLTEVTFKVLPVPERGATLMIGGLDDAAGIAVLAAGLGSPFEVSGAAHLPAGIGGDAARTLLRIEGFADSVAYRLGELRRLLRRHGVAEVLPDGDAGALWAEVRDVVPLAEPRDRAIWRLSVPPSRGPAVAAAIGRALPDARWFYDWGGGLVWVAVDPAGDAGAAAIRAALRAVAPSGRPPGHATLVRAPEAVRAAVDVFEPLPEAVMRVTRGVKAALDPAGLFNPGRMYAGV